jgi:OOP family OmpA-OmpF porin
MSLRGVVYFDFDRYDIRGEQLDAAKQIADAVQSQMATEGQVQVKVDGHTDAMGSSGYNMALGERRALAVKEFLTRKGIDPASIQINSFGESRPEQTNETEQGRALNRRAEVLTSGSR